MADRLSRRALRRACRQPAAIALLLLAGLAAPASAQSRINDPTRPASGVAPVVGAASVADEAAAPLLQSVLLPEKGKPIAIIGGKQVRLGEMFGDSRLVKLTDREAVLVGPGGSERLLLTPAVEKKNVTAKPSAPPPVRVQKGGKQ